MAQKNNFEYESVQDVISIQRFLKSLSEGFEKGQIKFNSQEEELVLNPEGLLDFKIRAKLKDDKSKIELKISWKKSPSHAENQKLSIGS
ncbi:MAG: amphi-Trp domain-containing protein [Desulfobacteraceae bacterium]|jgi:amphi-Trp domain-containing protein